MAVALLFDLFALHVCCGLRLFLLGLRKKLLHLEPQALILLEHLIDGEFEEELIGVLYEVEALSLGTILSFDEHTERLRSEGEKGLVVKLSFFFLIVLLLAAHYRFDALLDLSG